MSANSNRPGARRAGASARHLDVHQHQVGTIRFGLGNPGLTISGLCDGVT